MSNEIVLPPGTEFVGTAEIPALIAEALYPEEPDEQNLVIQLTKTAKPVAEGEPYGWPTTIDDDDRKILEGFWIGLPELVLPIALEAWRPYAEAFKEKGNYLDWELTCVIVSSSVNAASRRAAERKHSQALVSAIRRGQLAVLAPDTRIQTNEYQGDSIVTVEKLSQYVALLGIDVRVDAEDTVQTEGGTGGMLATVGGARTKGGRPRTVEKKAYILHRLIERMTNGKEIDPSNLPGSAANLLDICQRIEKVKTNKCVVFSTTEGTFNTWLKAAGYGFLPGRTPDIEDKYWTLLGVETMGLIAAEVFTGVIPEKPL